MEKQRVTERKQETGKKKREEILEIKIYNNIKTKQNTAAGKQGKADWGRERKYSKNSKEFEDRSIRVSL